MIKEIEGDLIECGVKGVFDIIAHCTNCWNTQGGGIAVPMSKTFGTDKFKMEAKKFAGDINKLGTIDYNGFKLENGIPVSMNNYSPDIKPDLVVVNMYGQFGMGARFGNSPYGIPFDYDAFRMCLRKMNRVFKGKHIGLPSRIGCGLAQGNWEYVLEMIGEEMGDCDVTLVCLPKKPDLTVEPTDWK